MEVVILADAKEIGGVALDEAAARRLQLVDYYRETYLSKPEWQGL